MEQSKREVIVGKSLNQPFHRQRPDEHDGSCSQYSTAYLDDVIASIYTFLPAVDNVTNDEYHRKEYASCSDRYYTDFIFTTKQIEYQVEDKSNHKIYQYQDNARQNVCQNLLEDSFSFLIHKLFLSYRI